MSLAQVERKVNEIGGQSKLAEELGLHRSHIHLVLSGKRKPSLDVFFGIAGKLKMDPEALYKYLSGAAAN